MEEWADHKKKNNNKKAKSLGRTQREEGKGVTKENSTSVFHTLKWSEMANDAGLEYFTFINTFMLPEIYFLPSYFLERLT